MQTVAIRLIPLLAALLLAACGFQPRGSSAPLDPAISPLQITGIHGYSELYKSLARHLETAGVKVTRDAALAAARLVILEHGSDQFVLSLDRRTKLLEVELRERVRFRLDGKDGERVPEQAVSLLRVHFTPKEEVLGRNNERDTLLREMREELAGRIVQRLSRQL